MGSRPPRAAGLVAYAVALALLLSACGPLARGASGAGSGDEGWRAASSKDGNLTLGTPKEWRLVDDAGSTITLETPEGYSLLVQRLSDDGDQGRSQPEVLEGMLSAATAEYVPANRVVEEMGRRVWMGKDYIWHEVHYTTNPTADCSGCRPTYQIDMLAFPGAGQTVKARLTCPGAEPPTEEALLVLEDVIDTVRVPGTGKT